MTKSAPLPVPVAAALAAVAAATAAPLPQERGEAPGIARRFRGWRDAPCRCLLYSRKSLQSASPWRFGLQSFLAKCRPKMWDQQCASWGEVKSWVRLLPACPRFTPLHSRTCTIAAPFVHVCARTIAAPFVHVCARTIASPFVHVCARAGVRVFVCACVCSCARALVCAPFVHVCARADMRVFVCACARRCRFNLTFEGNRSIVYRHLVFRCAFYRTHYRQGGEDSSSPPGLCRSSRRAGYLALCKQCPALRWGAPQAVVQRGCSTSWCRR